MSWPWRRGVAWALAWLGLQVPGAWAYTVLEGNPQEWRPVGPNGSPPLRATGRPVGHHLQLSAAAQGGLHRLQQGVQAGRTLLEMGRLSSARGILEPLREESLRLEQDELALKLSPAWAEARAQLEELWVSLRQAQARGQADPEGEALAKQAAAPVLAKLQRLEAEAPRLAPTQLLPRVQALRQELEALGELSRLRQLLAWDREALAMGGRLQALEQQAKQRQSHRLLADGLARLSLLELSSQRRLAAGDLDRAQGDLLAMEEGALELIQQLKEAQQQGLDLGALRLSGIEGDRQGRAVLSKVEAWLAHAKRREELLREAADPWRRVLTGDRLRLYGMRGQPTWTGAPPNPTPQEALAQPLWLYWELLPTPPGAPPKRLRHRFRFDGDRLTGHDTDAGAGALGPVF